MDRLIAVLFSFYATLQDDQIKKDEQKKIVEEVEKKKAELNGSLPIPVAGFGD
jgi:hypothetical protein